MWVKPTGAPTAGVYDGTFLQWNGDTSAWDSTDEECLIREAGLGKLIIGKPYLGRIVDDDDGTPVVQVVAGGGIATSDCTGVISSIKSGRCFLLETNAGDGSCGCVPAGQSAKLTYNSARSAHTSSTLLYGCPPGVLTTLCPAPTGAPGKFNLTVAGLTGGYTNFNQNYTISYTTGETYAATKGGVTVTAVQTGAGTWTLTLTDGTTTITYAASGASCCAAIAFTLSDDGGATDAPSTLTLSPATSCGKGPAYTPILDKCTTECMRSARLRWEPVAGSGAKTILFDPPVCGVDANGNKYADFSTDDLLLCTGTEASGCGDNKFTVRVTCTPCDCPAYTQPGWYCVDGACRYLDSTPEDCRAVSAGPFETEEECGCFNTDPICECEEAPQNVCLTFEVISGPDKLGLGGLTFPLGWYRFLDPTITGNEQHGWRWGNAALLDNPKEFYLGNMGNNSVPGMPDSHAWLSYISVGSGTLPSNTCVSLPWGGGGTMSTNQVYGVLDPPGSFPFLTAGFLVGSGGTCEPGPGDVGEGEILWDAGSIPETLGSPPYICAVIAALNAGLSLVSFSSDFGIFEEGETCYKLIVRVAECDEPEPNTPVTYKCVNGVCTAVYDGSGTSLADCVAACAGDGPVDCDACGLSGATATLVCAFGTFTAVWSGSAGVYSATFTDGSFTGSIRIDCVSGLPLVLARLDGGGGTLCTLSATSSTCGPPAIFVFDGTCTGGGTATVTT